ncbi:hypothetical protein OVA07_10675 [Novosphingobium sp. SL115]|uniref:hypothetical protein n=1 Tax=Novosphingobium sp. SL115 TaxID=2995150 RepID=UPI002273F8FE|nr:hypothetical protein [Novosphingobium sp. SL115]MCY1671474.1 hypothetical protein [Novosphingobium sp. SL115]
MADKLDSTSWTGDTSHRDPEFTPAAKAVIGKTLKRVALATVAFVAGAAVLKGMM